MPETRAMYGMLLFLVAWSVSADVEHHDGRPACHPTDTDCGATSHGDEVLLMQTKVVGRRAGIPSAGHGKAASTMAYFRQWAKRTVAYQSKNGKPDASMLEEGMNTVTASHALALYNKKLQQECPQQELLEQAAWGVHDSHLDEDGVHHFVFRAVNKGLHYLAARPGHLLASDPKVCSDRGEVAMLYVGESAGGINEDGGEVTEDLDADPVRDCKTLLKERSQKCPTSVTEMKVTSAECQIIDGIKVHMCGRFNQHANCVTCERKMKYSPGDEGSLLQIAGEADYEDVIEEDVCSLAETSNLLIEQQEEINAILEVGGLGDLSMTKGFEHVNDHIPLDTSFVDASAPEAFDMREQWKQCFPDDGGKEYREVIRNQGNCGSCWAFAGASALMNSLCISNNGASNVLHSATDRMEVSVQQALSCNHDTSPRGCNGGWYGSVDAAIKKKNGIIQESQFKYQCGGGNPLDHFDDGGDCKSPPWGVPCSRATQMYSAWTYLGVARVNGEEPMKAKLAAGKSMYVSYTVMSNFMGRSWWGADKKGIYTQSGGSRSGGHAVTGIGYGTKDGVKYWLLQNSWGKNWCDNGYFRFLRGSNFMNIESGSAAFDGKVNGAGGDDNNDDVDDTTTTTTRTTTRASDTDCKDTNGSCSGYLPRYANCKNPPEAACQHQSFFRTRCAKTFGYCSSGSTTTAAPTTAAPTTAAPTTTTRKTEVCPKDSNTPADKRTECAKWATEGKCSTPQNWVDFMKTECACSCLSAATTTTMMPTTTGTTDVNLDKVPTKELVHELYDRLG